MHKSIPIVVVIAIAISNQFIRDIFFSQGLQIGWITSPMLLKIMTFSLDFPSISLHTHGR